MTRAPAKRSLRGRVAVIGIGETAYYRHGASPDAEFKLALKAILAACEDAGIDPREIDGFASYSDDRSEAARLAAALGIHRLRSATMQWGGGGGGCCAAVANAAASIVAGLADCVVVFRALAQGQYGRFGQTTGLNKISGERAYLMPYGVLAPPQRFAMRVQRYMHEHGVRQDALRAIALASYHHAQLNPRAVMHGKPLDETKYEASRWIVEPGKASPSYLPSGLPIPVPEPDGLSAPYWAALRQNRLLVQRCARCHTWQFGPEWLCHCCHGFDPEWTEVAPKGRIFS
jgi:acetyl-CoA acetyltransferase